MPDETTTEGMTEAQLKDQLLAIQARVKVVSDEAKGHRLNYTAARERAEAAEAAKAEVEKAAEARIKQIETEAGEKLSKAQQSALRANLRAAAKEAGAADPGDMLALIPADRLKVNDDGEIENAAELLAELKKAKPYLFGAANTSSTEKPPAQKETVAKKATEMTDEEYRAERERIRRAR